MYRWKGVETAGLMVGAAIVFPWGLSGFVDAQNMDVWPEFAGDVQEFGFCIVCDAVEDGFRVWGAGAFQG